MNYKFIKKIDRFNVSVEDFDLISFFCLNLFSLAYFFEGDEYIGFLDALTFMKSGYHFEKKLLRTTAIRDFHDAIKDHKKIINYFKETKLSSGIVINDNKIEGQFVSVNVFHRSKSSQKKIEAFEKISFYKDLVNKYIKNNKDKKIGVLNTKYYDFTNPFFPLIDIKEANQYDIVLDCFLDWSISREMGDKFLPMDEFLTILLLEEIKDNKELKNNLYFYSVDYISDKNLFPDEKEQLRERESFYSALENKDYLNKVYGRYPKDLEYITNLGIDVNESVILINNGAYWQITDSTIKGDLENFHRVTPSNTKSENHLNYYGPCITYGIYTSRYSTIEEITQKRLNDKHIDFSSMNYGAPTGTNFLNDLFTFIYTDNLNNSINLFFNLIGKHVKKYLVKEGFHLFNVEKYLMEYHYWFLNNEFHLTPYGNRLLSDLIFKTVDFKKKYVGSDLNYLRKIEVNPSYYLIEHNVEGYKEYLRKNKFPNKGRIGMIEISANPFTLGHAHLIDYAVSHSDYLYVFVVEDNLKGFPYFDRFSLIEKYCKKYRNVKVLEAGAFLGSKHTITAYFYRDFYIKFDAKEDVTNFKNIYLPILDIDVRFMGEEKESEVTNSLNDAYISFMKEIGKELVIIPRITFEGNPISAFRIRKAFRENNFEYIKKRVPDFVYDYLLEAKDDKII